MIFYDNKGNRYKANGVLKPKYLSLDKEINTFNKFINGQSCIFYQKADHKYIHFYFKGEWFKGFYSVFKDIDELYDADHLIKL